MIINILEYNLTLSTGEELSFCEFDSQLIPELCKEDVRKALSFILRVCTTADRHTIERAKRGETKPLERLLRTPPYGCLAKLDKPICSEIKVCSMANIKKCTTKNLEKKSGGFPICWSYSSENEEAKYIASSIINFWKDGKYVLLID